MSVRILVVEDSEDFRDMIQMTLEFSGYDVVTASNGQEGLEAARAQGPFAAILTDLDMPVMNGVEFIRNRRAGGDSTTPIIALTAELGPMLDAAVAAGATTTLAKPFEPMQLINRIQEHVASNT